MEKDDKYKSKLCTKNLKGMCNLGDKCLFAHGEFEVHMHKIISFKMFGKHQERFSYVNELVKFINGIDLHFKQLFNYLRSIDWILFDKKTNFGGVVNEVMNSTIMEIDNLHKEISITF